MTLSELARHTGLSRTALSESLTVLIQHQLARWATVDEGTVSERIYYECFFEDIYPLIRYGKEIQLAEKYTGLQEISSRKGKC
jgi:DNA-binding transcriptional regulator GbsR (MarR family)